MHREKSGTIHFCCKTEQDCYQKVRQLLSLIPHFYGDFCAVNRNLPDLQDEKSQIGQILPKRREAVYDMKKVIGELADKDSFLEVQKEFARNIVIGFGKISGQTVAFVANQPYCMGGVLDVDSSVKAARFIRYCDCFDIPIVTLTDVPGFMPGIDQEEKGMIRHGAKLLYAYGESTVPKITVILRRAYGGAYIAMGSKHLGSDFVYAWPDAEIAVMGEAPAIEILYRKSLAGFEGEEKQKKTEELTEKYKLEVMNAKRAVEQGYIDEIITPEETRKRIQEDLQFLCEKKTGLSGYEKAWEHPVISQIWYSRRK